MLGNGIAGEEPPARRLGRRTWQLRWPWLLAAAVLVAGLASALWYLSRALPPPRVTEYTQITHEGSRKYLAGTDGARLYFTRDLDRTRIAQVAISGGESAAIPVPLPGENLRAIDVSPDGSTLLVISNLPGLWSVRLPEGSLRRLSADGPVSSAAWSPDGKQVVYSTVDGDIYVVRSDGTGAHRLTAAEVHTVNSFTGNFAWSPDGGTIRFDRDSRLYEMSPDGSGLHPLSPASRISGRQCCGHWTPDGRFFLFLSRDGPRGGILMPPSQIWTLDERRTLLRRAAPEPVQLTSGPIRWDEPISSKDGKKIFARGVIQRGELMRYDARSRQLQPYLAGISAEHVSFSRDGRFMAYVTFPEGILWKADRDGSNPVQLTDPPWYPTLLRWSPDGAQILFTDLSSLGMFLVSTQGGAPRRVLPEGSGVQMDPNWSPDGQKIVFSCSAGSAFSKGDLRILDLASGHVTTLPGSVGMYSPRLSPNGRFIAALDTISFSLKVFDLEAQRWSVLQKGDAAFPTWSRDSRFVYFLRVMEDRGVYRVPVSGGDAERVVDLKGFRYTGVYACWFGLDPDGAPLLFRDVGTDDIYALTLDRK